ncbi:CidA/LrgA family protein [Amorphus orientalis]|uniref:Holin-like protein n=1 Tax=Amorphus orientalis TaxID=649198 RepID=A0AAE3VMB7_9HYPH|nr:CidA/LrgA family protein [Amorphus orientalis]MDQ0314749.1 holin-like protein [Amorphus orientalis]
MIGALVVLLGCQLAGEIVVRLLGLPLPGPVVGAALLAAWLLWRGIPDFLPPVAHGVLRNLSLLFVPAAVGVVQYGPVLAEYGAALAITLVISIVLALSATAIAFRLLVRLSQRGDD